MELNLIQPHVKFPMRTCGVMTALLAMFVATAARAGSIAVTVPDEITVDKAIAVTEKEPKSTLAGTIKDHLITFAGPVLGSAYEAQLTLKNGTVLQGVDMGWYSRVPDKPNADPLNDDDRQQMTDVLKKVLSFYDVNDVTLLKGNHNRAVMLVDLERGQVKGFHSDKGEEIIWRPELWYFENHHGGWEKVMQTDRVVRRERFKTRADYHAVVDHLRWVPELGGLKSTPKVPDVTVTLPLIAGLPATSQPVIPAAEVPHP